MSNKSILSAASIVLLMTSSCTFERQVFLDGQQIEWHKKASAAVHNKELNNEDIHDSHASEPVSLAASEVRPQGDGDENGVTPTDLGDDVEALNAIDFSSRPRRGMSVQSKGGDSAVPAITGLRSLSPADDDDDAGGGGNKSLVAVGWVLTVVGLLLLLFVSILLGLILMIGGIAMIIAGSSKKSSPKGVKKEKETTGEWQDVVYLQNGSVIRGMIVEQVPNVSLKIQTADGSVFVYEMKDVIKITKEKRP